MGRLENRPITKRSTEQRYREALRQISDAPPHIRKPLCDILWRAFADPHAIALTVDAAEQSLGLLAMKHRVVYGVLSFYYGQATEAISHIEGKET